jgi:Na+/melibiose symporter-like transporter
MSSTSQWIPRLTVLLALFVTLSTVVFAQPNDSTTVGKSFLVMLLTWSPIALFVVFFVWLFRRSGLKDIRTQRERHMQHMERVEAELRAIREVLRSRGPED